MISVIIPASNEAALIGPCLSSILASDPPAGGAEILVIANGCTDATADRARSFADQAQARGWPLHVIELQQGGKLNALNTGDAAATGDIRAYLDADVTLSPPLLAQIAQALAAPGPLYASGQVNIPRPASAVSRAYAAFYRNVPFLRHGVPGCGLFAVNAEGRAKWSAFPDIISDDTYVRLLFTPAQRIGVPARYDWPIVEGFANLVRVRQRQNIGVAEVARRYPDLMRNDDKPRFSPGQVLRLALRHPIGFAVYGAVTLAVRRARPDQGWTRGR
ncbi:glycosyltransferase [Thalassovita taeanensis]|uniref:Glycosyltransferase involved in cell wall bisynthesis n=1 Tax=Thalassovita taeanensis TaxID=657014 RepID=A0A1H9C283_9RHOB|nr:glycosyltransferase [Thalassovita taeanensis]SEP95252.1 Glycosyltransferase involved in cell wall bisynthesis [Thalassovita taeanensis]